MRYFVKKDFKTLIVIMMIILMTAFILMTKNHFRILSGIILIFLMILLWVCLGSYYYLKEGQLIIKLGPFKNSIQVDEIIKIRKVSLDQKNLIELVGKNNQVKIKPRKRYELVSEIVNINPNIRIDI